MMPGWATTPPRPEAWKVPAGSAVDYAAEQDGAAGGRNRRQVRLSGGRSATASIRLKRLPSSRRVYAYLRYSLAGKTITKYVGDVTAPTRLEALRNAWELVHQKNLI